MGQYYKPIVLKQNWKEEEQPIAGTLVSYDYDNGAKLMEHSYVGNNFVKAAMRMIEFIGQGKAVPFVWCGDYADPVDTPNHPVTKDEKGYPVGGINLYSCTHAWIGLNRKSKEYEELKKTLQNVSVNKKHYIINETKKQFVRIPDNEKDKFVIHPLPILCADGNGRGGGDYGYYESKNMKLVGTWAHDEIRLGTKADTEGYEDCGWIPECEE